MLQYQTELRKAKATHEREAHIVELMAEMSIDVDVFGDPIASVRNSKRDDFYIVRIDEATMTATRCTCDGYAKWHYYCVHCEAVDRFFEKIYASLHREATEVVELVPVDEAMEEAQSEMKEHELDAAYAQLAQAQRQWCEHWAPLLGIPVEALKSMSQADARHAVEAYCAQHTDPESDPLTAGMSTPQKLETRKDELMRERTTDLSERGNLSSNRGYSLLRQ